MLQATDSHEVEPKVFHAIDCACANTGARRIEHRWVIDINERSLSNLYLMSSSLLQEFERTFSFWRLPGLHSWKASNSTAALEKRRSLFHFFLQVTSRKTQQADLPVLV